MAEGSGGGVRTTVQMGMTSWDQATDDYNYGQLAGNWQIVDFHDHSPGRGVPIPAGGLAAGAVTANAMAQGAVGAQNLSALLTSDLGINAGANVGRGYTNIAAAQGTSSTTATFLTTPDQVTGITLANGGILMVNYIAQVKASGGSGEIYLFINNGSGWNPVSYPGGNNVFIGVWTSFTSAHYNVTYTTANAFNTLASSTTDQTFVTTGMALPQGTGTQIVAGPGTYSIGVQYANTGGTTTAQNRSLWVTTENFQ